MAEYATIDKLELVISGLKQVAAFEPSFISTLKTEGPLLAEKALLETNPEAPSSLSPFSLPNHRDFQIASSPIERKSKNGKPSQKLSRKHID